MEIIFSFLSMDKKKNICLYWAPGSFGDIINYLLINSGYISACDTPYVDNAGRVCYSFNDKFNDLFNFSTEEQETFYLRTWSSEDLIKVSNLKNYIIGTHRIDQAKFIKETLKNQIQLVGITYTPDHYNMVLKNCVNKVLVIDATVEKHVSQNNEKLIKKFKEKNLYASYLLKVFQRYGMKEILTQVDDQFDQSIPIDLLINGDLEQLTNLLSLNATQTSQEFFTLWYQKQNFNN